MATLRRPTSSVFAAVASVPLTGKWPIRRDGPSAYLLFFAAFVTSVLAAGAVDGGMSPATAPAQSAVARQAAALDIDPAIVPALDLAMWTRWADRQLTRFTDASTPLGERLPARHVRSWDAAAARLDTGR